MHKPKVLFKKIRDTKETLHSKMVTIKDRKIKDITEAEDTKKRWQKNSIESILMRWMKLEPIIQSEVSQKDKDHYSILTHIYGI